MQMVGSGKSHPKWGNPVTKEHTWNAVTDKWILAQKFWIPKTQLTYQTIPKNKEGEGPGPRKAWCSNVGDYQDREMGGSCLGNVQREEGLWDLWRGGNWERENHLECKQRI